MTLDYLTIRLLDEWTTSPFNSEALFPTSSSREASFPRRRESLYLCDILAWESTLFLTLIFLTDARGASLLSTLILLHFPFLSVCNIMKIVVWLQHETENDFDLMEKSLIALKMFSFAFWLCYREKTPMII